MTNVWRGCFVIRMWETTERNVIAVVLMSLAMTSTAQALTFKKGEVLGSDGKTYSGASPEQMEKLIERAKRSGDRSGVTGNNVFVVVGDDVTFVPVDELRGKTKESQITVIGDAVVQDMTGNSNITYAQVETVNDLADKTGMSVEEILGTGEIEGIDQDLMKEIEAVSAESGISVDNLLAVNDVIENLPEGDASAFMDDLGELIEEGLAEQVDEFLTELREIEGALDAITQFDSYESCVSGGGGAVCDQVNELMESSEL